MKIGKRYGRIAALGAAAALLAGCGGADEPAGKALNGKQVQAVLPDETALPGWKVGRRDEAEPLPRVSRAQLCGSPDDKKTACDGLRFYSQGHYTSPDERYSVIVSVFAAEDTDGAQPAYDFLWKRVLDSAAKPQKIDSGVLGDEHDAFRTDYGRTGGPAAQIQVRVGATVLQITGEAGPDDELDADAIVDLASVVTERAEQAGRGSTPSAALGD